MDIKDDTIYRNREHDVSEHHDQAIPPSVKLRIFDLFNGQCAICSSLVVAAQYDHVRSLCNGGQHRESNLQLLCLPCHQDKTRADVAEKSKVNRIKAKHIGLKKPRTMTRCRRFDGTIVDAKRER